VARHAYWDWASRIGQTKVTTLEEAGDLFAELFRMAVRQRIPKGGSLAAHLSGGMDSSSVVCLAREELARKANSSTLFALSLVYRRPSLVGERSYIDLVLRQGGPVEPHFLEADGTLDFDWFQEAIPQHDEPSAHLRSMPSQRLVVEAADRLGAVMTLSGLGSDEIADYPPYHLADLLRWGRWLAAVKEAGRWARARNQGLWSVLRKCGLQPLWPIWWREGWGPLGRQGYGTWPKLGLFSVPPWVRPDFARRYQLRQRGQLYAQRMFGRPTALSWTLFALATTSGDWGRWHLAAPRGLNFSHPFRDPRLVCFTLGLPTQLRGVPGMIKPVLQAAMRGVLPKEIRIRGDKHGFDDMYGLGLRRHLPHLEELVRHGAIRELGILNPEDLIGVLHKAALGIGDVSACDRLDKSLCLIAWFDQIVRRRPSAEPVVVHRLEGQTRSGKPHLALLAGRP
jgi:asparagine synthase (glutamine-hydrolysing)